MAEFYLAIRLDGHRTQALAHKGIVAALISMIDGSKREHVIVWNSRPGPEFRVYGLLTRETVVRNGLFTPFGRKASAAMRERSRGWKRIMRKTSVDRRALE
jgi:hypothetical protein